MPEMKKVYKVTVKDGSSTTARLQVLAPTNATAERLACEYVAATYGGWADHYRAKATPKLVGGVQLELLG